MVVMVVVALAGGAVAQALTPQPELPDAPRPRPKWDFYVFNGAMVASIVADDRITAHGIARGCAVEGNPRYRLPNGQPDRGKYYAENGAIAAGIIVIGYVVHRYAPRHPEARVIVDIFAVAETVPHLVAVGQWVAVCR